MMVCVLVCETRPLPVYPIVFRHAGLPVCGKHSAFHFIHRHVFAPVGVVNLATCVCLKSEEEGPGEKNPLQYFEFGLQYLVQPSVNPTYSTFNEKGASQKCQPMMYATLRDPLEREPYSNG